MKKTVMKGPKTEQEWIDAYTERSGEEFEYVRGFKYVYDPMHGFLSTKYDEDRKVLVIGPTCGDTAFWRKHLRRMYEEVYHKDLNAIEIWTMRNVDAYLRMSGGKVIRRETIEHLDTGKTEVKYVIWVTLDTAKEGDIT